MEMNKYGVNKDITYNCLFDNEMRKAGFNDLFSGYWIYSKRIPFPKELENTCNFRFTIIFPKEIVDNEELKIEVRDKEFDKIYDYFNILVRSPNEKVANIVYKFVEKEMLRLKQEGIILGHYKGREIFNDVGR